MCVFSQGACPLLLGYSKLSFQWQPSLDLFTFLNNKTYIKIIDTVIRQGGLTALSQEDAVIAPSVQTPIPGEWTEES